MTRATSKFRGWRAVEDIHSRILRQRDTLRNFLGSEPLDPTHEGCILDQRIEQLFVDFSDLQLRKEEISKFAETVEILLKHVQETQVSVKEKYNHTVSHVSTMYPEVCGVSLTNLHKDLISLFVVVHHHCAGRKLQGSIPTVLGSRYGCPHVIAGYCHSILENIW